MNTKFLRFLSATLDHACEVIDEYETDRRQIDFMGVPVQVSINQDIPDSALMVLATAQECFGDFDQIEKAIHKHLSVKKKPIVK